VSKSDDLGESTSWLLLTERQQTMSGIMYSAKRLACSLLLVFFLLTPASSNGMQPSDDGTSNKPSDVPTSKTSAPHLLALEQRSRVKDGNDYREVRHTEHWNPRKTAIVVCDMWDDHTCKGAARRVAEMAPALDQTVKAARDLGVLIIHAPSGTMSHYAHMPQRRRAMEAPHFQASVEIKWNYWDARLEGLPLPFIRGNACGCEEPCAGWVPDHTGLRSWKGGKPPWSRQIETIEIESADIISDSGQEIFNVFQDHCVDNVILMGVHTNVCVCGRPFGLRQMVYHGKNVVLCRDLTDSFFQPATPAFSHFHGTELVIEHIEARLCPTITSTSFTGKPVFKFADAKSKVE